VIVLVNEVGDENVDSLLFQNSSFLTKDLTRTCVGCTSLAANLNQALLEISSPSLLPSWLLVESSPLAHHFIKDSIKQTLRLETPPLTILMIDENAWIYHEESNLLMESLIKDASLIFLTKIKEKSSPEVLELVDKNSLKNSLTSLNPHCPIVRFTKENLEKFYADLADQFGFPAFESQHGVKSLGQISLHTNLSLFIWPPPINKQRTP
jgi:G3E family GTPase